MHKFKIQPLTDWVLIKVDIAEEESEGGIIIPDTVKEKPQKGIILAVGKGRKDEPMTVRIGDLVLYGKDMGTEITMDGIDGLIIKESNIFGIIQPVSLELI